MPATLAPDPAVCATPVRMKMITGRMLKHNSDSSINPAPKAARGQFGCRSYVKRVLRVETQRTINERTANHDVGRPGSPFGLKRLWQPDGDLYRGRSQGGR